MQGEGKDVLRLEVALSLCFCAFQGICEVVAGFTKYELALLSKGVPLPSLA